MEVKSNVIRNKTEIKGITLIALVITVIVLLILAGVSIAILTGENGIITQANKAKIQTEIAEEKEQIKLAYVASEVKINLGKITPENLQEEIENRGYKNTVTKEKDENGKEGLLINLTKKDRYYFIQNKKVIEVTKEEFSKEITPVYAILYSDGDLRFNKTGNIDETKLANGSTVILKSEDISILDTRNANVPWGSQKTIIKSVTFEEKVAPKYTAYWFFDCSNIENINNLYKLETSNVLSMKHMFDGVSKVTLLDVSDFNTSNVTEMHCMFTNCKSLTKLDLSGWDTQKVTKMDTMFYLCESLIKLDVSNFDTSNITSMNYMFGGCKSLNELDVSNFNTSNVTEMSYMFNSCSSLTKLDLNNFNTLNVTNMSFMLNGCSGLKELVWGINFKATNLEDTTRMFYGCSGLNDLDLSSFLKENKITTMERMFADMSNLKSLNISNMDTSKVTNMNATFLRCKNLTFLDMRSASFDSVTDDGRMFEDINSEITVIVKDDNNTKSLMQGKLGESVGNVYTVSEYNNLNQGL